MKIKDLWDVLFPRYCLVCGKAIFENYEKYLCISCYSELPLFIFSIGSISPIVKTFWGRCEVKYGGSFLMYQSGSLYSNLFKEIKYRDRPDLGVYLGNVYGHRLKKYHSKELSDIDMLLPVPMTKKKQAKRGYNQAECIALGLQNSTGIEMEKDCLQRVKDRGSQTRKSKFDRWLNAKSVYECGVLAEGIRHVAIIDDVVTTGATIEACIDAIRSKNDVKISVFSLGFTQ